MLCVSYLLMAHTPDLVIAVIIQMQYPFPPEHNDLAVKREDGASGCDPIGHGKGTFVGKVFVTLHHIGLELPLFILDTDLYGDHIPFPCMLAYHVNRPVLKIHRPYLCIVNSIVANICLVCKEGII